MKNQPIPLITGFYADEARPWSQQDIVNWLPCAAEADGTRTPLMAKTPPGLSPFVEVAGQVFGRGVYNCEGRLFTVIGTTLYQITTSGVAIPQGTVTGSGQARFAHNQVTGGNELLVVNGNAGFVYNTATQTFTVITDDGYPGAIDAVFLDGYLIQIEPARRFAFHSDLNDALSYNTLDRFTSEVSPDKLVGLAVSNNELILFSETTAEFFENTGASQQPFRSKRIAMQKGCAGRYTISVMDNTVFWLGDDGVFYRLDGYTPRRISTRPIEQAIRGLDWAQAIAWIWEDSGHSVCYWTFPDGQTWGYDVSQPPGFQWHRRESYGLNRWRVNGMAYWNGSWVAGDFQNGRVWELDWDYILEGDQEFISEVVSPVIHDNQNIVMMPRLELMMDTGAPETVARTFPVQPSPPSITGTPPAGTEGVVYGPFTYTLTPGTAPIAGVSLRSGTLPPGLTLNNAGTISGTPTTSGTYPNIVVRVTDTNGLFDEITSSITIAESGMLFAAIDNLLTLRQSVDAGLTWPNTVTTGLTTITSEVAVGSAGGRVFHFGASTEGRTSTDGANFVACTGLTTTAGIVPGNGNLLKIGTEWQLYHDGLHVSTDGIAWSLRSVPSGSLYRPVNDGATVVAVFGGRFLQVSTDSGVTFSFYNASASLNASEGVQRLLSVPGVHFLAFGRDGSGNMLIGTSTTGLSGSWTFVAGPATAIVHGAARNPTTGRILIVLQTGACWYSDTNGSTWVSGATVPYAGALSFPPQTANNLIYSPLSGGFLFGAAQGGGVNRIYRTTDGVAAWAQVYEASPLNNAIQSIAEFQP